MDRYHIYEAIGRGKHSVVYKGRRKKTIQYYAIKSVDKSQRQRVLQEVQVLRATSHPGVLRFHAWYETQNHLWLILEYCVGGDLLGVLKQDVALPEASVARFAADLCESLRVVHAAGTLHCDLKPSNVLMDEDGRLKLCGFGLARKVADVSASRTNASNATPSALARRGTPCYMAPELFEEGGSHSFASDLYAFGCVLYELAAGKPPFVSASLAELMEMILTEDPPPIEREGGKLAPLSDAFEDLVFALLRKDPTRRATWAEIFAHPFWRSAAVPADVAESVAALANTATPLPRQPAFEARARERARLESPERPASPPRTREERPNREKPRADAGALDADATRDFEGADSRTTRSPATTRAALKPANGSSASRTHAPSARSKEVTRLSLAARANLEREEGAGYAREAAREAAFDRDASPSPKRSADKARADKAGDVSLADADAELNFAEAADEPSGKSSSARPLSGGGLADGDAPVATEADAVGRETAADQRENSFAQDPGAAAGAAAAAAERDSEEALERAAEAEARRATRAKAEEERRSAEKAPMKAEEKVDAKGGLARGGASAVSARGGAGRPHSADDSDDPPPGVSAAEARELFALAAHPTDTQVKPIVLNRRIESVPEAHFDAAALPFEALAISDVLAAPQPELEAFLTRVYRSVAHSSPVNEKVNTLAYFETLCCDTAAANVLINSSLMTLFVRMLRASKAPALRIRLTSAMGLLLRHATYITDELAASGIVIVLTECLRDKNERVRRRAMATLGELLFYIATQQHEAARQREAASSSAEGGPIPNAAPHNGEPPPPSAWQIPASTVGTVTRMLRQGEDEIAQHYAVKTMENIASHGGEWASRFCGPETVSSLVAIARAASSEQLRGTAASTLARACRASPEALRTTMEKHGVKALAGMLRDPSQRAQQAALDVLIRGLADAGARDRASLGGPEDQLTRELLPALVAALDRGASAARGKSALVLAALFRVDHRWMLAACAGTKTLALLDRELAREKDEFVRRCVAKLVDVLASVAPKIRRAALREIETLAATHAGTSEGVGSRRTSLASAAGSRRTSLASARRRAVDARSVSAVFQALIQLLGANATRPLVVADAGFLADVAAFLRVASESDVPGEPRDEHADARGTTGFRTGSGSTPGRSDGAAEKAPFPGSEEYRGGVLALLEALSRCAPSLLAVPEAVAGDLLPALAETLAKTDGSADSRFLALKLACDAATPLLLEKRAEKADGALASARETTLGLMKSSLLPLCPRLLRDEDPIPLYALKLLGGAVEADEGAVSAVAALGLAPAFFEFLSLEHTNNNVHNVRLCLALASSDAVPVEKLREYGAGGKVAAVLRYAHENAVEPFLEPALEMCRAVLRRAFRAKGEDGGRGGEALGAALECAAPLVELAPTLLERACVSESDGLSGGGAARLAAEALALATELLPEETGAAVFRPDARLAERVDAMGTVAALANDQRGFAELGSVPGWSAVSRSYERRGARDAEDGEASPRRCAASAQRIALEAVSAASRAPGLMLGREDAHVVDAEAALRRLARGEPNRCIADAAAEAADGVRRLLARRAAR